MQNKEFCEGEQRQMKLQKEASFPRLREFAMETAILLAGSAMFGIAVNLFIEPGQITMSGFTGISTTINHFFGTCLLYTSRCV